MGRHQAANAAIVLGDGAGAAPQRVGPFPRRPFAGAWPKWFGRRGWKWSPGGRPSCSTRPTTRLRSRPWSRSLTRVFPPGGDCWFSARRRKRTFVGCSSDCWAGSITWSSRATWTIPAACRPRSCRHWRAQASSPAGWPEHRNCRQSGRSLGRRPSPGRAGRSRLHHRLVLPGGRDAASTCRPRPFASCGPPASFSDEPPRRLARKPLRWRFPKQGGTSWNGCKTTIRWARPSGRPWRPGCRSSCSWACSSGGAGAAGGPGRPGHRLGRGHRGLQNAARRRPWRRRLTADASDCCPSAGSSCTRSFSTT